MHQLLAQGMQSNMYCCKQGLDARQGLMLTRACDNIISLPGADERAHLQAETAPSWPVETLPQTLFDFKNQRTNIDGSCVKHAQSWNEIAYLQRKRAHFASGGRGVGSNPLLRRP